DDVGEHVHRRLPALTEPVGEIDALGRLVLLERGDVDVVLLRESGRRRSRSAIRLERRARRRPRHNLFELGLPLRQARDACRQPPGRAETLDGRPRRETILLQSSLEVAADLARQARQPACGNLLAPDLNQQLAIHRLPRKPWRCARRAAAREGYRPCARSRPYIRAWRECGRGASTSGSARARATPVPRRAACPRSRNTCRTGRGAAPQIPPAACRPGRTRTSTPRFPPPAAPRRT